MMYMDAADVEQICAKTKKKVFSTDTIFKKFYNAFDKDAKALLESTLFNYVNMLARSFNRRIGYTEKLRVRTNFACTFYCRLIRYVSWVV